MGGCFFQGCEFAEEAAVGGDVEGVERSPALLWFGFGGQGRHGAEIGGAVLSEVPKDG